MKISYGTTRFGGFWHCSSKDIMILVWHVILQGSCDFISRSLSSKVMILLRLVAIGTLLVENSGYSLTSDLARPRDQRVI